MDFSGYKIYIGPDGDPGHLYEKDQDTHLLENEYIYSFNDGIKKLKEEKKPLYLNNASSKEVSDYFKKAYGIWAC